MRWSIPFGLLLCSVRREVASFTLQCCAKAPSAGQHGDRRDHAFSRRQGLGLLASAVVGGVIGGGARQAGAAQEEIDPSLSPPQTTPPPMSRLLMRMEDDAIRNPGLAGFGAPTSVFVPSWLFGTWNVTMRYDRSSLPLGTEFVPERLLRSLGAVSSSENVNFSLRFYSTLPNTAENTLRVSLGQLPIPQIVPDRAYNTRSVIDGYYGYSAVSEVFYDPEANPLRMTVQFSTVGPDLRPLPNRRQELFINNIKYEENVPGKEYVCSEYIRSATLGRSVTVSDSETLSHYVLQPDGSVSGKQRVAIYLTPNPNSKEGADFFETGGRAVLLMDYTFTMSPILFSSSEEDGVQGVSKSTSGPALRCVLTPKGIRQCVGDDLPTYEDERQPT